MEKYQKYRYLDDIATADLAFVAEGKTLSLLFKHAAEALAASMISLKTITPKKKKTLSFKHGDIERLLFNFLEEIIYLKDAEQFVHSKSTVAVAKKGNEYHLTATLFGEKLNPKKQEFHNDVKAVTMHLFRISKTAHGFKARVVLDI
ncbi:archease [Candidatus Woesearchaeota archaeon]|nr:archease [Candidatus Woesearchaeota archaeon]